MTAMDHGLPVELVMTKVRKRFERLGLFWTMAPGYVGLFVIRIQHSLGPLRAGTAPPDLGYGRLTATSLQFLQVLCFAYLFGVYGWTIARWRRLRLSPRNVAWSAGGVALMAWTILPANSTDVLEYLGFGRLVSEYHVSPYSHTYSEFPDGFSGYLTWDEPMPYGPLVLPIFAIAGLISRHGVVLAVYALKAVWLLLSVLNAYMVYVIADSLAIDSGLAFFVLAFNPVAVVEQLGDGHNDGLLVCFGLLAVLALVRGRERAAVWLAALATLVKTPGLFWLAGIVVVLIRRRRWRALGEALAATAGCALLIVWLVPGCAAALTLLNSQWQYSEDSLHTVLLDGTRALASAMGRSLAYGDIFRADRLVCSALFAAICAWRYARIKDVPTLIQELGRVMLVLLLGYAVSVYPWYASWVIPLAALTDLTPLRRSMLIACGFLALLYAVPYAWVELVPRHELWSALRLAAAFGIPIAVWATHEIQRRRILEVQNPASVRLPYPLSPST